VENYKTGRKRESMPKCGVCGGGISNTLVPHGAICDDDRVGERVPYSPEIDDLIKMEEEFRG
jgi:hypothetical protein